MGDELQGAMIYTTTNSQQAALAKSMLKSANIEHVIKKEDARIETTSDAYITSGGIEFWVHPDDEGEAKSLLGSLEE